MTKQELRQRNLRKRAQLANRAAFDEKIHKCFLAQPFYREARVIMTYLSYKSEVDTHRLIKKMLADGKTLCAPVCAPKGKMEAFCFHDFRSLAPSEKGILEPAKNKLVPPEEIDLILVPGCAFQKNGYRLGYGGGYYDRFLPDTRAKTCGFFYEALKSEFTPEDTDVPLDYIITEENMYHFI